MNNGNVLLELTINANCIKQVHTGGYIFQFEDGSKAEIAHEHMKQYNTFRKDDGRYIGFELARWLIDKYNLEQYITEDYDTHRNTTNHIN